MPLNLSARLRKSLKGNDNLRQGVEAAEAAYLGWFESSTRPFFTDYTDHGTKHLQGVMTTADQLITEPSAKLLSAEDVAMLVLSVLLHDSALHLSESGFYDLIFGSNCNDRLSCDDKTWPELWSDFLFAARRWDERKLEDVFGRDNHGRIRGTVETSLDPAMNLLDSQKKLIGEFLRWHHPRLAHEFALFGVPTNSGDRIELYGIETHLRDIAGLIARSHGMPIRPCIDYLEKMHGKKEPFGVHATYVMSLLRVSDYLQIQADRAPQIIFRYKRVWSPLSVLEHEVHQCVKHVSIEERDPERITIEALPTTVHQFLRLKDWLAGIQRELDDSWAAIGEAYGHSTQKGFALRFRRIRSTIQEAAFQQNAEYVADQFVHSIDGPEILRLLVRPLYHNDPAFGIRELLQNSLDAVNERVQYRRKDESKIPMRNGTHADVIVHLSDPDPDGSSLLSISDSGIGMREDVVKNYFLKAGASFRRSQEWTNEYETDDGDQGPRSRVLRTGKFGIGALAGFLLADEFKVETRHILAPYGLRFTTHLSTRTLELRKDVKMPTGTRVEMRIGAQTRAKLLTDNCQAFKWYFGSSPTVQIKVGSDLLNQQYFLPLESENPPDWIELPSTDFARVLWTLPTVRGEYCKVAVNGLRVPVVQDLSSDHWTLQFPCVSFSDPDGALPLDLAREQILIAELPTEFRKSLEEDIVRLLLAGFLIHGTDERRLRNIIRSKFGGSLLMRNSIGICPYDPSCISDIGPTKLIIVGEGVHRVVPPGLTNEGWVVDHPFFESTYGHHFEKVRIQPLVCSHPAIRILGMRLLGAHGLTYEEQVTTLQQDIAGTFGLPMVSSRTAKHFTCVSEFGECGPSSYSEEFINSQLHYKEVPASALEIYVEPAAIDKKVSVVARLWRQIIGRTSISDDADQRREEIPDAFNTLKRYVEAYIAMHS